MINLGSFSGGGNLPNVHIRPTWLDRVLELLALLVLLGLCVSGIVMYAATDSGIPSEVWCGIGSAILIFLLLLWASYAPSKYYNFPVRTTAANIVVQYRLATRLCRVMNIGCMLLCLGVAYMDRYRWAAILFLVALIALAVCIVGYMLLANRLKA